MLNWSALWTKLFGTTTWLHIDIGFWVSMGISLLVAILMVVVFWSVKPYQEKKEKPKKSDQSQNDGAEDGVLLN